MSESAPVRLSVRIFASNALASVARSKVLLRSALVSSYQRTRQTAYVLPSRRRRSRFSTMAPPHGSATRPRAGGAKLTPSFEPVQEVELVATHVRRQDETPVRRLGGDPARQRHRRAPSRRHGEHARFDPRIDVGLAHAVRAWLAEPARAESAAMDGAQHRLGADLAALGDVGRGEQA